MANDAREGGALTCYGTGSNSYTAYLLAYGEPQFMNNTASKQGGAVFLNKCYGSAYGKVCPLKSTHTT